MSHIYYALDPITVKDIDEAWSSAIKNAKEVGKVKKIPYFSLKVVKAKKCREHYFKEPAHNGEIKCSNCGRVFTLNDLIKPKGNWVNGENLDKIKFPCFCSYRNSREAGFGLLSVNCGYYYILNVQKQEKGKEDAHLHKCNNLELMIRENNIHILKGKIIIFEEE